MRSTERPEVTIHFAQTLDGRIAFDNARAAISSDEGIAEAHRARAEHDAVLVGARTSFLKARSVGGVTTETAPNLPGAPGTAGVGALRSRRWANRSASRTSRWSASGRTCSCAETWCMPRELWFEAPRAVSLREGAPLGEAPAGGVIARALASGVSQGTELLLYRGEGPTPFDPSL